MTLNVGGSSTLTATVSPSNATDKTVTWTTSSASVATVSGGKVTAVGAGTATITATTSGGQKATCTVTVRVPVTGISISRSSLSLNVGATSTLTATVLPSDATNKSYSWSSNNTGVATVNSSGLVTAKANGTATITATTTDGGKKATCAVTVTTPASGVSVAPTTATIIKGQTQQLTATVAPSSASNKSVSWSSSNNSVAAVSSTGLVTAKAAGTADVTVTTADGNYKAVCKVTVRVPVTSVSLSKTELTLIKGDTEQLLATVSPSDASNKTVSWTTTDKSVASVSSSGLVTAVGGGNATITATTADGSYTDICNVTVSVPVEGIKFNDVSANVGIGSTTKLNYTITPPEATNKTVTWQSADPAIATVDETTGVITPVAPGGTEITVTTEDGGYTDTTLLIVTNSLSTIKLKLITESGKYPTFGTVYYKSPGNVIEYPGTPVGDDGNMTISVPVTLTSFNLGVSLLNTLISGTVLNPETKDATATPLYMVEGDFNADNLISGTDWTILVQRLNYGGGETKYGLTGDMNYDGVVDNLDLLLFNSPNTHTGVTRFMTSGYDMSVDTKAVTESENAPALNAVSFAAAAEDTPDIKENQDKSPVSGEPPIKSIVQITKIKDGRYEISLNEPSRNINMFQLALEGGISEITYALPSGFELIGAGEKDGVTVIAIGTTVKGGLTIPADTPFITVTAASQPGVLYGDNFTTAERASAHGIEIVSLESSETVGEAGASASGGSSGCNAGTAAAALLAFAPFIIHKSHKSYRNRRNHK
ncbi:Ig-like domain-containing protein [uncultured Cloacibacillus sp.]|uniref:Ig-like domain-containing protein n=1 Tax=uncultured Cloacibacillus sp. TaxID=889794 RepID=UPI0034C6B185